MHETKRGNKTTAQERGKPSCPRLGVCTLLGLPFMPAAHPQPILRHPHPSRLLSSPPCTLFSRLKVHCSDPSQSDATCCSRHPLHPQGHHSHECQSLFNPTRLCLVHSSAPCGPQSRGPGSFPDRQPLSTSRSSWATSHSCLQVPGTEKQLLFPSSWPAYHHSLLQMLFPLQSWKLCLSSRGRKQRNKPFLKIKMSVTFNIALRKVPWN